LLLLFIFAAFVTSASSNDDHYETLGVSRFTLLPRFLLQALPL
jgi:hypothetical protein